MKQARYRPTLSNRRRQAIAEEAAERISTRPQTSAAARDQRQVEKLARTDPVKALLKKGGLA